MTVLKQRVQYIDNNGKLITESLTDYTRRNFLSQYTTLSDFLTAWNNASRKQVILDALEEQGILIKELQEQIGGNLTRLICFVTLRMTNLRSHAVNESTM